jgi:hypothetical protein
MSDKTPLIDEADLDALRTAPDSSALAATPTPEWEQRLTERQQWLQQWDATLAPLLQPLEKSNDPFALKPQQINELLHAWSLGLPADPALAPANSAALLLQAHQAHLGGADLLPAIAAWGAMALACTDAAARHRLGDEAQAIKQWLQRWERKEAELAMLHHMRALNYLTPQDQERLNKLGGDAYKTQLMQVDPLHMRIALRDRVDSHSLERYFRDDPQAAYTMLAIRAKSVNPSSERLQIGRWQPEVFFNALRQATAGSALLSPEYTLTMARVDLTQGDMLEPTEVCIFAHQRNDMRLLMTILVKAEVAVIQLALLVPCEGLRVSDYCTKLLRLAEGVESSSEKLARGEIVDKVLQEALGALKTSASGSTQSPTQFAG